MRRVVITGLGAVSALGNTVAETWEGIKAGRCGIEKITVNYDPGDDRVRIAAECKEFDPTAFMDKKDARKMARFSQFAVAAAVQAVADAGLSNETIEGDRTGVMIGNGIGGFEIHESSFKKYFEAGHSRIPPLAIPLLIPNEAAGNVSMHFGLHGVSWTITTACASSTDALGNALDLIRSGRMDMCLAGGTEAAITGFGINAFSVLQTLASDYNDEPHKACCPFDKKRSGPDPSGISGALAMTKALEDAGVKPEDVQYYNAHGTSTPINDPSETAMIKKAFGQHAYNLKISSTKSMIGHCLGAAGALEAIICVKAIEEGFCPPTVNLTEPDLEAGCDLNYLPQKGISCTVDCAASGSLGFGGHNGVLVFKKVK